MDTDKIQSMRNKYGNPFRYHGDLVRRLFVGASVVMIATLPFLNRRSPGSAIWSIPAIIVIASTAGFMSSRNTRIFFIDFIISVVGLLIFEYRAVDAYTKYSSTDGLFVIYQILAIIFLFALYNSAKMLRAVPLKPGDAPEGEDKKPA